MKFSFWLLEYCKPSIVCLKSRETFLLVAHLSSSGCLKVCKDAQFIAVDSYHRTGLVLLVLLGCQGSSGIVPNGSASSYLGFFNTCQGLNC